MAFSPQLVTRESVASLRVDLSWVVCIWKISLQYSWTSSSEFNSQTIIASFLSINHLSEERSFNYFYYFLKCFFSFHLEKATSYPYTDLQKPVQTLSLLISFLLLS